MKPAAEANQITRGATVLVEHGAVEVLSWTGEGSYARVYRGRYQPGGRGCALKVAKPEVAEAAIRLREERRVLLAADHPRVVAAYDSGCCGDVPLLVLEWLEGGTLADQLAGTRMPVRQVLEYLEAVAEGLAHLHGRGLLHGDVRPQNLFLVPGRGAVLVDPGGTVPAPGGPVPSAAEDVRAVGALLYQMLTGTPPSADRSANLSRLAPFNRGVVRLWEQTQAEAPLSSAELLAEVRRLRQAL